MDRTELGLEARGTPIRERIKRYNDNDHDEVIGLQFRERAKP